MMAIRSDKNDKYSQPDGRFIGAPGKPTGVGYDASELRGAQATSSSTALDHREVAFNKLAFAAMYEFITGKPPASMFIAQEPLPVLNGKVTGIADGIYTNLPVADAEVEIYEVDAKTGERKSAQPMHRKTTGEDGLWGPFVGRSDAYYEFVLHHGGATHHPHLPLAVPALERRRASAARRLRQGRRDRGRRRQHEPAARLFRRRPRQVQPRRQGAARHQRRRAGRLGGQARVRRRAAHGVAVFNNETIPTRTWPAKDNHLVIAEFLN